MVKFIPAADTTGVGVRHYLGKEWDGDAKLYYFGARYYDSENGLFLIPDPTMQNPSLSLCGR